MAKDDAEKFVRLVLPKPVHDRLRVVAAQAGLSMAAFCAAVVEKAVQDAAGKGGKKDK